MIAITLNGSLVPLSMDSSTQCYVYTDVLLLFSLEENTLKNPSNISSSLPDFDDTYTHVCFLDFMHIRVLYDMIYTCVCVG